MNREGVGSDRLVQKIPKIKAESETQTTGHLVSVSPETKKTIEQNMEPTEPQHMSIRKRRNLSKNRGQAMRQREKTPEPGRTLVPHDDTTTSDDEDFRPQRPSSREIEADSTYEEMKRMVQEKAGVKDPVYDMDTEEILEARAMAANDRRRRSVSPFAVPDKEELCALQRKGSFIDPTNKLLSTTYTLSPKEEDPASSRRSSLTIETFRERRASLTPPISSSPKDKSDFPYPIPTTPKRLDKMVYPDEAKSKPTTPAKKDEVFTFEESESRPRSNKQSTPKPSDTPVPGEIVTKVIQIERTPSRKLSQDLKPTVEVRQRVVRTPSRKSIADAKPIIVRQPQPATKPAEPANKLPPVKPARSRSASRLAGKNSESEMSEDQGPNAVATRRKVVPTPRRFLKNKNLRENRSQSVNRVEEMRVVDKTGSDMSETSREIVQLLEQARARSLSIPKDDPKLLPQYRNNNRNLVTPNKTPSTPKRNTRGISCPKTIQIISDKEILQSLPPKHREALEKTSRQSSGYIDASQSEYTSSCYSSSPSDNEYNFDLSEKTAELTRKLHLLSQEIDQHEDNTNILLSRDHHGANVQSETKSVLRKRSVIAPNTSVKKEDKKSAEFVDDKKKTKPIPSRWKFIRNWRQFKEENRSHYVAIKLLANQCLSDLLLLVFFCGIGGMMFRSLEGQYENAFKCSTRNVKRDFIESLWRGSHHMREEEWKSMARKKLYEFEDQLHTAHEAGVTSYSGQRSWNFMNSFVYCLTLVTTIGYGHIAPKTTYGRIATIVYAIIGIPLFLIVLADFGKLFTRIIKFFWAFIRRFYYTRSCKKVRRTVPMQEMMKGLNIVYDVVRRPSQIFNEEDMADVHPNGSDDPPPVRRPSDAPPPLPPKPGTIIDYPEDDPDTPAPSNFEIDDEFNLPISVATFILIVYIIIGAFVYKGWEQWTFFESFYFVFISMSTIGLGDLVPDHPIFMMTSIVYLVFGLALTSMCINVVQVKLSDTFKKASAKLGATIGLRVAEEDGSLVPITPPPTEIAPIHMPKKVDRSNTGDDAKSK